MAASQQFVPAATAHERSEQARASFASAWTGAWGRVLIPSLSDCFFLAVLVWLFVAGPSGWKSLLMDGDTGWHIRAGEYILAHGSVPRTDLFSFSKAGAPWFAWEWLTDVLFAVLFRAAGLKGIVLFSGAMIAAFATIVLRFAIWRGANALMACVATLLAIGSASVHFLARPHVFTLLLLPICVWMIEADRRRNTRAVWLLVPMTAVWTNLHGGFLILLACLALLAAGCLLETLAGKPSKAAFFRYSGLTAACAAASLANPYGIALHAHIAGYLRSDWIRNLVQEFQAPTFRSEGQLQLEALLIAGVMLAAILIRQRRIPEALWIVFLAHSALTSLRHAPLYAAVAGPLGAGEATLWWRGFCARKSKASVLGILYQLGEDLRPGFRKTTFWPVLALAALALVDARIEWPRDFPSEAFPAGMVNRYGALLRSSRVLAPDQWGDYLIFRQYPGQKVFFDGRSDFYGEALGTEYLHLMQGAYDWNRILNKYRFEAALLPVDWPLASLLKQSPAWKIVEDDGRAVLFVTRRGAAPKL